MGAFGGSRIVVGLVGALVTVSACSGAPNATVTVPGPTVTVSVESTASAAPGAYPDGRGPRYAGLFMVDGKWLIGEDAKPGEYVLDPADAVRCDWSVTAPDGTQVANGHAENVEVSLLVKAGETLESAGCRFWVLWPDYSGLGQPNADNASGSILFPGTYLVGKDIRAGYYAPTAAAQSGRPCGFTVKSPNKFLGGYMTSRSYWFEDAEDRVSDWPGVDVSRGQIVELIGCGDWRWFG